MRQDTVAALAFVLAAQLIAGAGTDWGAGGLREVVFLGGCTLGGSAASFHANARASCSGQRDVLFIRVEVLSAFAKP